MTYLKLMSQVLCAGFVATLLFPSTSRAQTTKISTEYLMTLYAPLEAGQEIDPSLYVYNVRLGGWVKGPQIKGTLACAGWRLVPSPSIGCIPSGRSRDDQDGRWRADLHCL